MTTALRLDWQSIAHVSGKEKEREEGRESKEEGLREGGRVMGTGGGIADGVCAQGIMSALDRRFSFP